MVVTKEPPATGSVRFLFVVNISIIHVSYSYVIITKRIVPYIAGSCHSQMA